MTETSQSLTSADETTSAEDLPPGPVAGDVIYVRYRWAEDGAKVPGKKFRPVLVVKVSSKGDAIIGAPFSTKKDRLPENHLEIPQTSRSAFGLSQHRQSFIKFNEINRIDLPNDDEIHTHVNSSGWLTARKGRVDEETLRRVQIEIGRRTHEKTLKGVRIPAKASTTRSIERLAERGPRFDLPTGVAPCERHFPGDAAARHIRQDAIRAKAAQRHITDQKEPGKNISQDTR
jgi:hypothetical protein